jgi:hypothetical protein
MFNYTLIMPIGKVIVFNLKACADLYQRAYGGVVITQQVLNKELDIAANAVIIEP